MDQLGEAHVSRMTPIISAAFPLLPRRLCPAAKVAVCTSVLTSKDGTRRTFEVGRDVRMGAHDIRACVAARQGQPLIAMTQIGTTGNCCRGLELVHVVAAVVAGGCVGLPCPAAPAVAGCSLPEPACRRTLYVTHCTAPRADQVRQGGGGSRRAARHLRHPGRQGALHLHEGWVTGAAPARRKQLANASYR